jgi:hypothetical protein
MYQQFHFQQFYVLPTVSMCSVLIWEQTAIISFHIINSAWDTALQTERWRVRFPMVSIEFLMDRQPPHGNGVDSASNSNDYKEYFLGVKVAGS